MSLDYILLTPQKRELLEAQSPIVLARYGISLNKDRVYFKPIKDHSALGTVNVQMHDYGSGGHRKISADSEVLHFGSMTGISNNGASYDNCAQLRTKRIWGNPRSWTYVGTKIVPCGSGHMGDRVLLYVDKKELCDSRDVYFDPEGLDFPSEFGKTFRFAGGIPVQSISSIEFFQQRDHFGPDLTKVLKVCTVDEFLAA